MSSVRRVVVDTNVFVAAAFNRRSSSAELVRLIADGALELVWNDATRRETANVLRRIPRIDWGDVGPLFQREGRHGDTLPIDAFGHVADPDDRKFAALAAASQATLVTNDDHLLSHRGRADVSVMKPSELMRQIEADGGR